MLCAWIDAPRSPEPPIFDVCGDESRGRWQKLENSSSSGSDSYGYGYGYGSARLVAVAARRALREPALELGATNMATETKTERNTSS